MKTLFCLTVLLIFACHSRVDGQERSNLPESEQSLGQLIRFDNDWFANGNRANTYVVSHKTENSIELYTKRTGVCGAGVTHFSMKMSFDPASKKYVSRLKLTNKNVEYNVHRLSEWLAVELVGSWNGENNTMTWTDNTLDSKNESSVKMVTQFVNSNLVILTITGTGEFRQAFVQDSLYKLW